MDRRPVGVLVLLLLVGQARGQYPATRTFDIRTGLQRPRIELLAQDAQDLLWMASDQGLLRSDGERTDVVRASLGDPITALFASGDEVWAASAQGYLLHARGYRCDTLGRDTMLLSAPARAIRSSDDGTLWIGTYGAGLLHWGPDGMRRIGRAAGLPDEHVNALCEVGGGRLAVATDQGIALCDASGRVVDRIGEEQGAPDNLVLSLAADGQGHYWAGTDRSGVFRFDPDGSAPAILVPDSLWHRGAVHTLAVSHDAVWAGTTGHGVVVLDTRHGLGAYALPLPPDDPASRVSGLLRASDGAVWWCNGTEHLERADPDVLIVPEHEGLDLRHITALCTDGQGRLWFATDRGIFRHDVVFADRSRLHRAAVEVDPQRPVVTLHAAPDGTVWAGTFGEGIVRIAPDGSILRYRETQGLCNDNVLAIRSRDMAGERSLWMATLGGVCKLDLDAPGPLRAVDVPITGPGFTYDVLPLPDGRILVATDGNGILCLAPDGKVTPIGGNGQNAETYYALCRDEGGRIWACGPGTGLCEVKGDRRTCAFTDRAPFDGDIYALAAYGSHVVVVGKSAFGVYDPATERLLDLGDAFGLEGTAAELNTICTDRDGALWLGCDKGLVRLTPDEAALSGAARAHITGLRWGDLQLPLDSNLHLRHDQDLLTFRFAAPYYAAPEQLRFAYRLIGSDPTERSTRDREVTWSRLPPGSYRFEVRAVIGENGTPGAWTGFSFVIDAPWWRSPWALAGAILVLSVLFYAFIRTREERMRYRDRVEKERTRFQLDALRSQVNPHFLFNSFTTLIDLIERDRVKAVEHVEHLSDFFREILAVRDRGSIPLTEELRLVRTYFFLEQRRFGDRIALRIDVPASAEHLHVPPLTLQLLVENAIKHNAFTAEEPLVVRITVHDDVLEVRNVLRPRSASLPSTGFGIESIQRHYAALTDRPVMVLDAGADFVVRIPLLPAP